MMGVAAVLVIYLKALKSVVIAISGMQLMKCRAPIVSHTESL
jgi:hypothetical protein